jgi:hypothetical protein
VIAFTISSMPCTEGRGTVSCQAICKKTDGFSAAPKLESLSCEDIQKTGDTLVSLHDLRDFILDLAIGR